MSGKITIDKSIIASYDGYVLNDDNFINSIPNGSIILSRDNDTTFLAVKNKNDIKLIPNISLDYTPNKITTIDENGNLKQINLSYDEINESINVKNINIIDGYIDNVNINTLNSSNITSNSINSTNLNVGSANFDSVFSTDINCDSGTITNFTSTNSNINNIESQSVILNTLSIKNNNSNNFTLTYNGNINQNYGLPITQGNQGDFLLLDNGNIFSFKNFSSTVFKLLGDSVYHTEATVLTSTTSTAYIPLMSINNLTPNAVYLLLFSCSPYHSNNNIYSYFIVNNNGININDTETILRLNANQISSIVINKIIQANGQTIGIYWRTTSGILSCLRRSLILLRVG